MPEAAVTEAFRAAQPAVRVDGRRIPDEQLGLMSLSVQETVDGLYRCEATFSNWGAENNGNRFIFFDKAVFDFGATLEITMGDGDAEGTVFKGRITAMEGRYPQQSPPEFMLLAEDRLQDLRMSRRTRSFEETNLASLFSDVAGEHGLQLDMDFQGPDYSLLTQVNQSDLAFMRDCLRKVDAELWIEGDTIYVRKRPARRQGEITLRYGYRLLEFSVCADLAEQRTSLVVSGWNVANKEGVAHEADSGALQSELGDDTAGGKILDDKFGARVERIVHEVPFNDTEAREAADAGYRRMARRFLTGRGIADGDARLRVGSRLRLDGLGAFFNGKYYVCEVAHNYEIENGYRTFFQVERAGIGGY